MSGSSVLNTIGRDIFRLGFEISPIILQGGLFGPGGLMPIVAITEAANFLTGLLANPAEAISLDNFFAHFQPMAGGTLIENQVGTYPFANLTVAANAIIVEPLRISLLMRCPVRNAGGYTAKLATFMALQAALEQHTLAGGTYIVATPAYIYTNCLLTGLRDVTGGEGKQVQTTWQWDFMQPLITQAQAAEVQNSAMGRITNGTPTDGATSGAAQTAGNPLSGAAPATQPALQNTVGGSIQGSPQPPVVPVTSEPLS